MHNIFSTSHVYKTHLVVQTARTICVRNPGLFTALISFLGNTPKTQTYTRKGMVLVRSFILNNTRLITSVIQDLCSLSTGLTKTTTTYIRSNE